MPTYYIDPYTKYQEALTNSIPSLNSNFSSIKGSMKNIASQVKSIKTYGVMSDWEGIGYEYLTNSTFDDIQNSASLLAENLDKPLTQINQKARTLLTSLNQLKSIDETLDQYKSELAAEEAKLSYAETDKERKNIESRIKSKQNSVNNWDKKASRKKDEVDKNVTALNNISLEITSSGDLSNYIATTQEEETLDYLEEYLVEARLLTEEELENYKEAKSTYSREISLPYGKMIKVFQQRRIDGSLDEYVKDKNGRKWSFADHGCGPTSAAIIISAVDSKITPVDTYISMEKLTNGAGHADLLKAFDVYDLEHSESIPIAGFKKDGIKYDANYNQANFMKELKQGKLIACSMKGTKDAEFTTKGHWVVVYGVTKDEETGKEMVLIADPAGDGTKHVEPFDAEKFMTKYLAQYISVDINSYEQDSVL